VQDNARPFAGLTPDVILDAIEAIGYVTDGRLLELNSYENRVWQVGLEGAEPVVAKFYRPGRWSDAAILEEHAYAAELAAAGISVVPPLTVDGQTLHHHAEQRVAVFPRRGGHAPALDDPDTLRHLGRVLGQWHAVGRASRFTHRGGLDIAGDGEASLATLRAGGWVPMHLQSSFFDVAEALLDQLRMAWERAGTVRQLRLHGDCHPGNILWRDGQAHFVDLDDARTGPALQDLWMLLSGEREDMQLQLAWLLDGYMMFSDFDPAELHLLEALRSLRMLRHQAWLARRWDDPAFPRAFPWFEQPRHWEDLLNQLREQQYLVQEAPLLMPSSGS
jgi:Ser/Thr protein kinase RdoA (MazF antagonist)